jgi:hypothetical protein
MYSTWKLDGSENHRRREHVSRLTVYNARAFGQKALAGMLCDWWAYLSAAELNLNTAGYLAGKVHSSGKTQIQIVVLESTVW